MLLWAVGCGAQGEQSTRQDPTETRENEGSDPSRGEPTVSESSEQERSEGDTGSSTEASEEESSANAASRPADGSSAQESGTASGSGEPQQTGTGTHAHSYRETVVKPTCTEKGYTLYTCSCGDSDRGEETAALGHLLEGTDPSRTVAATETKRGSLRYVCTRSGCGQYEDRETYSIAESCELLSQRMLYWINVYRAGEGAKTVTRSDRLTRLSQYRAKQALQGGAHAGHNFEDGRAAAEATKCGTFYDITEVDPNTGEQITPFWEPCGQEAYCTVDHINLAYALVGEVTFDDIAKQTVEGIRASAGHWAYVGAKDPLYANYVYIGIGISTGGCYLAVSDYDPDQTGYERYYYDAAGNLRHEWVKP